jgi:predicted GNAT family acetyltransferase
MELFILKTSRLRRSEKRFIADHLTRPGSDFQRALLEGEPAGTIAICLDQGEVIGWARSETWQERPTIEAFVATAYRRRGVATLCVAGLLTEGVYRDHDKVAVFSPTMAKLARRLDIQYSLFDLKPDGTWKEATR